MATWKELGEVPDSDEEDLLDSDESQLAPPPIPNHDESHKLIETPAIGEPDIWEAPLSSQSSRDENFAPQGPVPEPCLSPKLEKTQSQAPTPSSSQHAVEASAEKVGEPSEEQIESNAIDADQRSEPSNGDFTTVLESHSLAATEEEAEAEAQELFARTGRYFRPRKPIQEHPYLLESAQYSKILKSHGVRPIRVAVQDSSGRRHEEDSQEKDYEDGSQTTGGDPTQRTGESGEILQQDLIDDRDELALSSPEKLSSLLGAHPSFHGLLSSSQNEEDDLPSLDDLFKKMPQGRAKTYGRRQRASKSALKQKGPKTRDLVRFAQAHSPAQRNVDSFEVPPSPPQTSPAFISITPSAGITVPHTSVAALTPKPSSATISREETPASSNRASKGIDLTLVDGLESSASLEDVHTLGDDDAPDVEDASSSSSSEEESQLVHRVGRRIKGVLPASWVRLDQQLEHDAARKRQRHSHSPIRSPDRAHRKGVAQRRQLSTEAASSIPFFFDDDESDDDVTTLRSYDVQDAPEILDVPIFEDDTASVVEEDHIDRMLPGGKRHASESSRRRPAKRRKRQTTFSGQPGVRHRQQKITGLLHRSKSGPATTAATRLSSYNRPHKPHKSITEESFERPATPPRLSILDVLEPNAPSFIRIAARAARARPDKGRSSPSRKHISLGTRRDNIDALSILRRWKTGKIQTRLPAPNARQRTDGLVPLRPLSSNRSNELPHPLPKPRPSTATIMDSLSSSRKFAKQSSIGSFVDVQSASPSTPIELDPARREPTPTRRAHISRSKSSTRPSRQAQLETIGDEPISRYAFAAQKKALDAIYRRRRKTLRAPSTLHLEQVLDAPAPISTQDRSTEEEVHPLFRPKQKQRKRLQPKRVDITAPQYACADDPLPTEPARLVSTTGLSEDNWKLTGLGPFGTRYTQHFEIFPLEPGVFFHASTFIGTGRLVKAFDDKVLNELDHYRGHCTLAMNGDNSKTLRWGPWDAQSSSEMGILFDSIADQLHPGQAADAGPINTIEAMDFVVGYVQDFLSFPEEESGKAFVERILEVMRCFVDRLDTQMPVSDADLRKTIEVLTRCMLLVLQTLRLSERLNLALTLQLEELLKKVAKQIAKGLLKADLEDIRCLYGELQDPVSRDRGIRDERYSASAWVVLIRTLQDARIPRASFWDVVAPVMLKGGLAHVLDVQVFERLWRNLFTLLLLGEFDNTGVLVTGIRHTLPLEGWQLPQKLLERAFEVYKHNQRQSPSFNEYCRAMLSRCHYLVEHWGWRRCNAIVGTIFDFFASQGLSHLRNEQVYKSPKFLEELADSPSLQIQPEDRCFHIFLKLLALGIKRLRKFGLIKDVKNLVARVLPNHDRQYLKEKDIHETELAALRNHHDLLCTLFWSAPRELRPSVQTIEKLVVPGSSHKEACLINLRAWSQLGRFVVSSGEEQLVYKTFTDWQNNVFRQVLDQYLSAEGDIQQQFQRMSKDASSGVSQEMIKRVVKMNKQAAADVLHFSLKASLDVLQHAPTLAAASMVMNTYQLHEVFTHFCQPPDVDWSVLHVALDTVDQYLGRIGTFLERQPTSSEAEDSWHGDDAIMLLDRQVSKTFFPMAKRVLSFALEQRSSSPTDAKSLGLEKTIIVTSRFTARFLISGVSRLSQFFGSGKYAVFEAVPAKMSLGSRTYLCLFVANLVEHDIVEFKDIGATLLELFLCAITKPFRALAYENRFARALKQRGDAYVGDAIVQYGNSPDYNSNRDLFDHTITAMRKALRVSHKGQKQQLQTDFGKAIRAAMEQMKQDLKCVPLDTPEHSNFIQFIRAIVALIKTNDICPVDSYFYQISREYSPSAEDPRLLTATLLSYGLKLEDEDLRAVSGLFYFLYPNFKVALRDGTLRQERNILEEGLRNPHIFSFMLSRMLPALVKTAVEVPEAWLLLDVYVSSLEQLLSGPCVHKEIGEESMEDLLALLKFVIAGVQDLQNQVPRGNTTEFLHTLLQMVKLVNLFGPSVAAYLCMETSSHIAESLDKVVTTFTDFTNSACEYLSEYFQRRDKGNLLLGLLQGTWHYEPDPALDRNEHINGFAKYMVEDIQKSWAHGESGGLLTMTIRGPAATQTGQGTTIPSFNDMDKLAKELYEQLDEWNQAHDTTPVLERGRVYRGWPGLMPF